MEEEIDLIITWVDGSDSAWQREKRRYESKNVPVPDFFFRDYKLLRYWFRGVEKNLPWIRKIHFVTWGHLPPWLNTEHPKLHIVRHDEYMPREYVPTFSSHPIEWNFHRISGLSDKFIYSNDDTFFLGKLSKEYYFKNGLPCDFLMLIPITESCENGFGHILWNNIACINRNFDLQQCMEEQHEKYFHPAYPQKVLRYNETGKQFRNFPGFGELHIPLPFEKDTFEEIWEKERNLLHQTCLNRFRSSADVSVWLARYWRLAQGKFSPCMEECYAFTSIDAPLEKLRDTVLSTKNRVICLNEGTGEIDFEKRIAYLGNLFDMVLPEMCSFERF